MAVSRDHNIIQTAGVFAFLAGMAVLAARLAKSLEALLSEQSTWWVGGLIAIVVAGYVLADFASGFVHFLGDTFFSETTPIVGRAFVHPFREHHVDPKAICRHGFLEVNGNNCLVSLPILAGAFVLATGHLFTATLLFSLLFGVFLTNQFHRWAHMDKVPRLIAWLQNARIILHPKHHQRHHTAPYDAYFCITVGWLNPLLEWMRFFPTTRWLLRWILPMERA